MKRNFPAVVLTAAVSLLHMAVFSQQKKPNILLIYVDDMGYADLHSYGNKDARTPNIDGIGKAGVQFTQAYVTAPICSPSRAGILTGKYQQSFGYEFQATSGYSDGQVELQGDTSGATVRGIPASETTIAQFLKKEGYATGAIGKWHLGYDKQFLPNNKGFDYFFGFNTNTSLLYKDTLSPDIINRKIDFHDGKIGNDPVAVSWTRRGLSQIKQNETPVEVDDYLTFHFANEASHFIKRNKDQPFFLYLPFNSPVPPLQVPKSFYDKFPPQANDNKRAYLGLLNALDSAVGIVLKTLKDNHLDENTLVFFISDNGGAVTRVADNTPFKGGKFTQFEGGIRIPYLFKWPGKVPAGLVYDKPTSTLDVFATIADAVAAPLPTDKKGVSLLPYVNGIKKESPHDLLFWRNGFVKTVRKGDWKLQINTLQHYTFLYNIAKDKEEKKNLYESEKQKVEELTKELEEWERTLPPNLWPYRRTIAIPVGDLSLQFPS